MAAALVVVLRDAPSKHSGVGELELEFGVWLELELEPRNNGFAVCGSGVFVYGGPDFFSPLHSSLSARHSSDKTAVRSSLHCALPNLLTPLICADHCCHGVTLLSRPTCPAYCFKSRGCELLLLLLPSCCNYETSGSLVSLDQLNQLPSLKTWQDMRGRYFGAFCSNVTLDALKVQRDT